jgi:hypothetical protein
MAMAAVMAGINGPPHSSSAMRFAFVAALQCM